MYKRLNEKGITLIALTITIVVLLILASVAISSINNDNIIGYSEKAKFASDIGELREKIQLAQYKNYIESKLNGNSGTNIDYSSMIPTSLADYIEVNNEGVILFKGDTKSQMHDWASELGIIEKNEYMLKSKLEELVDLAKAYIEQKGSTTNSNKLVLQYIRRDRYKGGNWDEVAGKIDTNFISYVESNKSKSLDITTFTDPITGDSIDFVHSMASLNGYLETGNSDSVLAQYSCWAGDLCTLTTEVYNYYKSNSPTQTQLKTYTQGLLCGNSTFSLEDMLGDADAVNIWQLIKSGGDLDVAIYEYYYGNGTSTCANRYYNFGKYLKTLYSGDTDYNKIDNACQFYLGIKEEYSSWAWLYATGLIDNHSSIPNVVFTTVSTVFTEYIVERM